MSGTDKLSPVIKNAQQALTDLGSKSSKLDDIEAKFNKIANSGAPLKKQLRDIQKLMADMNFDGMDNTALFTRMAEHAGSLADAMGDARQAVNAFANDNFKLEAMAQGLSMVASAGSIATGVMGLFGTENEKVTQAILKVQSALAILNGVQAIANALNKDSALMLRLKQIRMLANTKTTAADTVATTANAASLGANTLAAKIANSARQKLNMTIAIGKALMGDWTGLLLVGAAALTTYAIATDDSKEKLDSQAEATKKATTAIEDYNAKVGSEIGNVVSKYKLLQAQFNNLKTEAEKQKWINENQQAFKQLGIEVNNLTEAQKAFVANSDKVVEALKKQARARAMASVVEDRWKEYYDDSRNTHHFTTNVTSRSSLKDETDKKALDDYMKIYGTDKQKKQYKKDGAIPDYMQYGAKEYLNRRRTEDSNKAFKQLEKDSDALMASATKLDMAATKELKEAGINPESKGKSSSSSSSKSTTVKTKIELNREELEGVNKKVKQAFSDYQDNLISREQLENTVNKANEYFESHNIPLKIDVDLEIKKSETKKWKDRIQDAISDFNIGNISKEQLESVINAGNDYFEQNKIKAHVELDFYETTDGFEKVKQKAEEKVLTPLETAEKRLADSMKALASIDPTTTPKEKLEELKKEVKENEEHVENLRKLLSTDISNPFTDQLNEKPVEGSNTYKMQALSDANTLADNYVQQYKVGLIGYDELKEKLAWIDEALKGIDKNLKIDIQVNDDGTVTTAQERLDAMKQQIVDITSPIGQMGQAFASLGNSIEGAAGQALAFGGQMISQGAQMVGQLAQIIAANQAAALAKGISSASGLMFPFNLAAIASVVGTITSLFASLPKFATGGVVGGGSYTGDKVLARLNSGEGVLTRKGMNNLETVMGNQENSVSGFAGKVVFDIDGTKLRGVLNNVNKKISKQS